MKQQLSMKREMSPVTDMDSNALHIDKKAKMQLSDFRVLQVPAASSSSINEYTIEEFRMDLKNMSIAMLKKQALGL